MKSVCMPRFQDSLKRKREEKPKDKKKKNKFRKKGYLRLTLKNKKLKNNTY